MKDVKLHSHRNFSNEEQRIGRISMRSSKNFKCQTVSLEAKHFKTSTFSFTPPITLGTPKMTEDQISMLEYLSLSLDTCQVGEEHSFKLL